MAQAVCLILTNQRGTVIVIIKTPWTTSSEMFDMLSTGKRQYCTYIWECHHVQASRKK